MKTTRKIIALLTSTTSIFIAATNASATLHDEGLYVGLIVGEPTGISIKKWTDQTHAIDCAIAFSIVDDHRFQIHADYLVHDSSLMNNSEIKGSTLWYYGVGARLLLKNDNTHFGIRAPLGIDYLFAKSPLDVFAEIAPIVDVAPKINLDLGVAIGLRYFFN
ncbi:MAG: hypothetical protein HGA97_01675 [Chlorobiaceae bacterium]|jgi:hypothetical protein|nr:hypothetical protein [Chlorobiaceae bacterium]